MCVWEDRGRPGALLSAKARTRTRRAEPEASAPSNTRSTFLLATGVWHGRGGGLRAQARYCGTVCSGVVQPAEPWPCCCIHSLAAAGTHHTPHLNSPPKRHLKLRLLLLFAPSCSRSLSDRTLAAAAGRLRARREEDGRAASARRSGGLGRCRGRNARGGEPEGPQPVLRGACPGTCSMWPRNAHALQTHAHMRSTAGGAPVPVW